VGEVSIIYVENLSRLAISVNSHIITDLAGNIPVQTMDVLPVIQDDRVLLPVRFMAYALGAEVSYAPATATSPMLVFITLNSETITITIGENAQIIDGRTMVPLRIISEFFGALVIWCDETFTIEILHMPAQ